MWQRWSDNVISVSVSCRCDLTESRDQGAHCHPRRQKQPVPVYGPGGKPIQLCELRLFDPTTWYHHFTRFTANTPLHHPADLRIAFSKEIQFYAQGFCRDMLFDSIHLFFNYAKCNRMATLTNRILHQRGNFTHHFNATNFIHETFLIANFSNTEFSITVAKK